MGVARLDQDIHIGKSFTPVFFILRMGRAWAMTMWKMKSYGAGLGQWEIRNKMCSNGKIISILVD